MISVSGTTPDGRRVLRGVYRLYETYGLPLDTLFDILIANEFIPDWLDFLKVAEAAGMRRSRVLSMLEGPVSDTYGKGTLDAIRKVFEWSGLDEYRGVAKV